MGQASATGAHRPSCSEARGLFPDWGSNPVPSALAAGFLSTTPPRKSECHFIKFVSDGINVSTHVVDVMSINERMKEVAFHQLLVQLSPCVWAASALSSGGPEECHCLYSCWQPRHDVEDFQSWEAPPRPQGMRTFEAGTVFVSLAHGCPQEPINVLLSLFLVSLLEQQLWC